MDEKNNFEFIYEDYIKDSDGDVDDFIFSVTEEIICEK